MSNFRREIEVKLRFDSVTRARNSLSDLGVVQTRPRAFEDNILYDRDHDPLLASERVLRLRRVGDRTVLTYKAPVEGEFRHKVRAEEETEVNDGESVHRMLLGLGFEVEHRYQKYRTEFSLGELQVMLDETPLGCFVELEGAPEQIDEVAERLGFKIEDYVCESYRQLHQQQAEARGATPGNMVFPAGQTGDQG